MGALEAHKKDADSDADSASWAQQGRAKDRPAPRRGQRSLGIQGLFSTLGLLRRKTKKVLLPSW